MSHAAVTRRRTHTERSSGNVFVDLGFPNPEACVMQMRAILAIRIEQRISAQRWSQTEAARRLQITKRQLRELLANTGDGVSLEVLLALALRAGVRAELRF